MCMQTNSPATKLIHTNEAILKIEYMNRDLFAVQTDKAILQAWVFQAN